MTDSRQNPIDAGDILVSLDDEGCFAKVLRIVGDECLIRFTAPAELQSVLPWNLTQTMMLTTQWVRVDSRHSLAALSSELVKAAL